jgi:hypothetical protein
MIRSWLAATTALAMATGVAVAQTPSSSPAAPSAVKAERQAERGPVDYTEAHIRSLHARLHITAAQETQWGNVAQVMRDNAKVMDTMIQERSGKIKTMTAVDDLRSYEKLAGAHEDGLKKLIPIFQTLYDAMSAEQKQQADQAFRVRERRPQHASK